MFISLNTGLVHGLESHLIRVEVDTSSGLPTFQMVGFLSSEVREARERIRVALKNTGFSLPPISINVNLSPASIRKQGTSFDLPVAIGLLAAMGEIDPVSIDQTLIIGELGLDGEIRRVNGILPIVRMAQSTGHKRVILPYENADEGALIPNIEIIAAKSLNQVFEFLSNNKSNQETKLCPIEHKPLSTYLNEGLSNLENFDDVQGQSQVKRAACVAAAGFHHMLMIGPPGAGKTMIAKRIPSILPPLTPEEALEVTSIYSVAGLLDKDQALISARPFLSPHHTITEQALAGGGSIPRPGVVSLSHRGVLFLDEMTEFNRSTLDVCRQPLEDKTIHISRSHGTYRYPADFMLVAACNPCPCGYYPDRNKCKCSDAQVKRYLTRVSGPLLDRIDICCEVEPVNLCKPSLVDITSSQLQEKVSIARARQDERFQHKSIKFNAEMNTNEIEEFCKLGTNEQLFLQSAYESLSLSARSYHRILKVSRTIADLDDSDQIKEEHLAESLFYRTSGYRFWGH